MCYLEALGPSALPALVYLEQNEEAPENIQLLARLLRENAQMRLASHVNGSFWSIRRDALLKDVTGQTIAGGPPPKLRENVSCTMKNVFVMRGWLSS